MDRHYGMDWLRIGAFGLLILYHIGMVFVPWGFHVKTAHPLVWAEIPMFLTNPWRLTLLFVVSGYASRALFAKAGGVRGFMRNRNARLLLPLLFGVLVIVPPQAWVQMRTQQGYAHGFAHFWARDYFSFVQVGDVVMPAANHLWFVFYLWAYTLGLAALLLIPGIGRAQAIFDRGFTGWRAVVLPAAYSVMLEAVIFADHTTDTHDFIFDGVAHLRYVPAFLFGFGLARSRAVMDGLVAHRRIAAAVAIASFATIAVLLTLYPNFTWPSQDKAQIYLFARYLETWTAIAALIGFAEVHWNRDAPWRATLAEATFPFYVIHQTMIVLVEYALLQLDVGPLAEFLILLPATVAGCWVFYLVGRRIGWLRPLIGLKRVPRAITSATPSAHEPMDLDDTRWGGIDALRAAEHG